MTGGVIIGGVWLARDPFAGGEPQVLIRVTSSTVEPVPPRAPGLSMAKTGAQRRDSYPTSRRLHVVGQKAEAFARKLGHRLFVFTHR